MSSSYIARRRPDDTLRAVVAVQCRRLLRIPLAADDADRLGVGHTAGMGGGDRGGSGGCAQLYMAQAVHVAGTTCGGYPRIACQSTAISDHQWLHLRHRECVDHELYASHMECADADCEHHRD